MIIRNPDTGEATMSHRGFKVRDPYGYIMAADYMDSNDIARREIIKKIGDTTNIRLPGLLGGRIDYDNERGTRGNTGTVRNSENGRW